MWRERRSARRRACSPTPLEKPQKGEASLADKARPTFAFLGGARLGKSAVNTPLLQAKTEISLSRALLVPEGVPRALSL